MFFGLKVVNDIFLLTRFEYAKRNDCFFFL